jgi:sporulation protein YlmC with PRC-barrel domain
MLKKLMITTAITGLMIGSAIAADNGMSPANNSAATTTPSVSGAAANSVGSAKFVNSQRPDQFLASKFKGTDVIGTDNQKIGDVSDILFDKDGKVEAYVVSVGGFIGIGSKDVALAPSAFQLVAGDKSKNESDKLKVAMTKDELKQASNFEPYKAPSSTTGMGSTSRPLGSSAMPSTRPAPAIPAPAPK